MSPSPADLDGTASALQVSIGLLVRRLRQLRFDGEVDGEVGGDLTMSETAALSRLDRGGPTTAGALARLERISPQSIGATLAALQQRGLVERRPDPEDGRRVVLSVTPAGIELLRTRRGARARWLAEALAEGFDADELRTLAAAAPLIERLAERR